MINLYQQGERRDTMEELLLDPYDVWVDDEGTYRP